MRQFWTTFWGFLNERVSNYEKVMDNIDNAMIDGSGALADAAKDLRP